MFKLRQILAAEGTQVLVAVAVQALGHLLEGPGGTMWHWQPPL